MEWACLSCQHASCLPVALVGPPATETAMTVTRIGTHLTTQGHRKAVQTKLGRDFTQALQGFQRVQRLSAEKQRGAVEVQKRAVELAEER